MNKKIDETYKLRIKFFKKTNMRGFLINNQREGLKDEEEDIEFYE